MPCRCVFLACCLLLAWANAAAAAEKVLDGRLHHLRNGTREWNDFPEQPESATLTVRFTAEANATEYSLRLRQQDVKQTWKVLLNGTERARLVTDENDMVIYVPVSPGALKAGENTLRIEQVGRTPDDIRVGEITLVDRPVAEVLAEGTVTIAVTDAERKMPIPCRLTVLNTQGALMSVGAKSGGHLAVRPGVVYTGTGTATFGLPAGTYTIHAGRGLAYGLATTTVTIAKGATVRKELAIRREVPLPGYVSCDPHVHTLTFSGHGDSTIEERMITLAGEGIELPIATDHNVHVDYEAVAAKLGMRGFFTPVVGNEVTTPVGHFCVFPVPAQAPIPDYKLKDWKGVFGSIAERTAAPVVILNHARDIHLNYRPFGPRHHNAATGDNRDGWTLQANGMEVLNSGSIQTDPFRLFHDWLAMLNHGLYLTPVGSSDSHDVARYIVGQGRTYIRSAATDPGKIDVKEAVANFRAGRVLVSMGLVAEITVNGKYGPGDLVPQSDEVKVSVRVLGPGWSTAERIELYANGRKIKEAAIAEGNKPGVKWAGEWTLPKFAHDVHLSAIASGPGVRELYWPIAKPYQPTSPEVRLRVMGFTGPVWIDADGDGKRTCARDYASRLLEKAGKEPAKVIPLLADYDEAVAVHAAALLHAAGGNVNDPGIIAAAARAGPQVERGFRTYFEAWRESEIARSK